VGDEWGEPVNLGPPVNTAGNEDRPFVSANGQELWFDGSSRQGYPGPAVFRSLRQSDGSWGQAEEIVSQFAAEPTLSPDGHTLYFVHHYFDADLGQMIEADIYVTRRTE
jgi:Tol biopolymer transport system component